MRSVVRVQACPVNRPQVPSSSLAPRALVKTERGPPGGVHLFDDRRHGSNRYVGVFGEALRGPRWSVPLGIRRLRTGRSADEAVRRRPYSVVLLDEVEKADEIFNILLQMLG